MGVKGTKEKWKGLEKKGNRVMVRGGGQSEKEGTKRMDREGERY